MRQTSKARFPIHWAEKKSRPSKRGSKIRRGRRKTRTKALNWSHAFDEICGWQFLGKQDTIVVRPRQHFCAFATHAKELISLLLLYALSWRRIPKSANKRDMCSASAGTIRFLLQYESPVLYKHHTIAQCYSTLSSGGCFSPKAAAAAAGEYYYYC